MIHHVENVGDYLKENGIKPSYQRMKIYEFLLKNRIHPTVDTIYKALNKEIPTLSKTTVYNTLNLFLEKKIINIVVIEENETRYDAYLKLHGHFKCEKCGNIYDIEMENSNLELSGLEGFEINEKHIYFKGVCKDCQNSIKN
ncbi:Fur family transcriptional regulator [Fusobacterium sp.]|uniref:Fur family transcriptional regulator n=1 Tax=Fusobacterium sp. TaxID=68766 RepID=UPI00261247BA|nr:Fur family transcriptional regulator [Fusobacterium sp.]